MTFKFFRCNLPNGMWIFTFFSKMGHVIRTTDYIYITDKSILAELIFIKSKQTQIMNFHFSPPKPWGKTFRFLNYICFVIQDKPFFIFTLTKELSFLEGI